MIYLDNNATTPVDPEVSDAILSSLKRDIGNPSSSHGPGRKARAVIDHVRGQISAVLGCDSEELFFTSGGTESNNLALVGAARSFSGGHIITSCIEHPSVINTCRYLESRGFRVTYAPVDRSGMVSAGAIENSLEADTVLVSVMHANNETGVMQPIEAIAAVTKRHGVAFHVDAAQSIGKLPFSLRDLPVDLLTVVSHKFYGPKGIGALFCRKGTKVQPIMFGASHESGMRPGTENVAGIVGLGKACELAERDMEFRVTHTTGLRDLLLRKLTAALPGTLLNGHETKRLPNTLNLQIPGIQGNELVSRLAGGIAFSTGSACHAGRPIPSAVLISMGLTDKEALSSVRISIGKDNTEEEMEEAGDGIAAAVRELRVSPSGQ